MRNQGSYPPRYQGPGADYESSEIDTEDELEAVRRVSAGRKKGKMFASRIPTRDWNQYLVWY